MKKYEQLIFAGLLAAALLLLTVTVSVMAPIKLEISGTLDSDSSAVQTIEPTAPPTTQAPSAGESTTVPTTETTDSSAIPQSYEEILAKYSELMNEANAAKVGFKKIKWQEIPEEKAQFEGKVFSKILPLASNFFKSEEDARATPEIYEKGGTMQWFPIYHNEKGCMLTDTSAIEYATCTELPDGNIKITIELKDEFNSEPPVSAPTCDSYVGSMFTPIQFASVRDVLENDSTIKFIIKNVDFDITYYDCTAELTYNPDTNQILQLNQFMHLDININEGSVLGISAKGRAVIDNYSYISDIQY